MTFEVKTVCNGRKDTCESTMHLVMGESEDKMNSCLRANGWVAAEDGSHFCQKCKADKDND